MNKKAKVLSDWYLELAKNDNGFETLAGRQGLKIAGLLCFGPNLNSNLREYYVNQPKPVKKIIDLSCVVDSDIDCEFDNTNTFDKNSGIGNLTDVDLNSEFAYLHNNNWWYVNCRIRQDKWMYWGGGDCPLPEGFIVVLEFNDKTTLKVDNYTSLNWSRSKNNCIRAFKVIGVAENARYEWQKEEDNE